MGKQFAELDADRRAFIARQHVFFVATAPLAVGDGRLHPRYEVVADEVSLPAAGADEAADVPLPPPATSTATNGPAS